MESINNISRRPPLMRRLTQSLFVFSILTVVSAGMTRSAQAQTFAEWFQQGKTQKKYLLQQIAALQVFSSYLKQGYQVASKGLGSISGSLKAENDLHSTYYNRLETVDPLVKDNDMVKDILRWQQDILDRLAGIDQISGMTADEKSYLYSVRSAVLKDCDHQVSTLQTVIADGKVKMSDAERLSLIGRLHTAMMDNYRFSSGFGAQAKRYAASRLQEQQQTGLTKKLYAIN